MSYIPSFKEGSGGPTIALSELNALTFLTSDGGTLKLTFANITSAVSQSFQSKSGTVAQLDDVESVEDFSDIVRPWVIGANKTFTVPSGDTWLGFDVRVSGTLDVQGILDLRL